MDKTLPHPLGMCQNSGTPPPPPPRTADGPFGSPLNQPETGTNPQKHKAIGWPSFWAQTAGQCLHPRRRPWAAKGTRARHATARKVFAGCTVHFGSWGNSQTVKYTPQLPKANQPFNLYLVQLSTRAIYFSKKDSFGK